MRLVTLLILGTLLFRAQISFAKANYLGAGKAYYESSRYEKALESLSLAIQSAPDAATRNWSYYYMGLSLFEMGMYYSSYLSFRNVLSAGEEKNKEVYEKSIKSTVLILDRLGMVDRIGDVLDKLPKSSLSGGVLSTSHYAIGAHHAKTGENDRAVAQLKLVNPDSPYYPKAQFHLGVLATKRKGYKEAVYYFDKAVSFSRDTKESKEFAELARLNLARSLYSAGELERSIQVYAQFLSSSPHYLNVMLEASWPLMRVSDVMVSLGNLHTVVSPFYREDLVGEGYILRATVLYSICKYEEMRRTLSVFFQIYDPVIRSMQSEAGRFGSGDAFYQAYVTGKLNRSFVNFAGRDTGISTTMRVINLLKEEKRELFARAKSEPVRQFISQVERAEKSLEADLGNVLQRLHKRKLADLLEQREQANYLKVEIVTGEKELVESEKGLSRKEVDVKTSVAPGYYYWPYHGEFWEDELGSYLYLTESACQN